MADHDEAEQAPPESGTELETGVVTVSIDRGRCMGSANCLYWAPAVFDLDVEGIAIVIGPVDEIDDRARQAATMCPTGAISIGGASAADASPAESTGLLSVRHDRVGRRYVIERGGHELGHLAYEVGGGDALTLTHTEIDPTERRKGLASVLVAVALDDMAQRSQRVLPACSYVSAFIDRHPGFADLVV